MSLATELGKKETTMRKICTLPLWQMNTLSTRMRSNSPLYRVSTWAAGRLTPLIKRGPRKSNWDKRWVQFWILNLMCPQDTQDSGATNSTPFDILHGILKRAWLLFAARENEIAFCLVLWSLPRSSAF
jgi:hypothetical protein